MKQLSDTDIEEMIGTNFGPNYHDVNKQVRRELRLGQLIPDAPEIAPTTITIDLHGNTEEQAWERINSAIHSGARTINVITGVSGILKIKFQDWITNGILAKYISIWKPINNGSFEIKIKKPKLPNRN